MVYLLIVFSDVIITELNNYKIMFLLTIPYLFSGWVFNDLNFFKSIQVIDYYLMQI